MTDSLIDRSIRAIESFQDRHGHLLVPHDHVTDDGLHLGAFLQALRTARRLPLSAAQTAALDQIEIDRAPDAGAFASGVWHLLEFHRREGHAHVPRGHREPDGYPLGQWTASALRDKAEVASHPWAIEVLDRLGALGGWSPDIESEIERFDQHLAAGGGPCADRWHQTSDGFPVGSWLMNQRRRIRRGDLCPAAVDALASRGVTGSRHQDMAAWGPVALRAFLRARPGGGLPRPRDKGADGCPLGGWVRNHREEALAIALAEGVSADLLWGGRVGRQPGSPRNERAFRAALEAVRDYVAANGHDRIPEGLRLADGRRVGRVASTWRRQIATGRMPADRAAELQAAGLSPRGAVPRPAGRPGTSPSPQRTEAAFQEALGSLREFVVVHGHADVPPDYLMPNGRRLADVVYRWRTGIRSGTLSAARAGALNAVGIDRRIGWRERRFVDALAALQEHVASHGSGPIPTDQRLPDGHLLADVVATWRKGLVRGSLPQRRAAVIRNLLAGGPPAQRTQARYGPMFDRALEAFSAFVAEHGHDRLPPDLRLEDGRKLARIVEKWRHKLTYGRVPDGRAARLRAAGIVGLKRGPVGRREGT